MRKKFYEWAIRLCQPETADFLMSGDNKGDNFSASLVRAIGQAEVQVAAMALCSFVATLGDGDA